MATLRSVCVFCGSTTPPDTRYSDVAEELGALLADRGIDVIYGGGRVGLMGIVADSALARGGRVIGVIPVGLFGREVGHEGLTELHEVGSMHERKTLMYDLANGFISLPGGLGTLEETAEAATWTQLGIHGKRLVLLDIDGFWQPLVAQLDRMVDVGLLKQANRGIIQRASSVNEAVTLLTSTEAIETEKQIQDKDR